MFVDLVLIPALKSTFIESMVYIPSSYEGAAINGLGKVLKLNYRELKKLISNMRIEAANCGNASEKFDHFFFSTYGYGLKSRVDMNESFMDALSFVMFDWEKMDLSNLYLDYGINIGTIGNNKTGFLSTREDSNFSDIIKVFYGDDHDIYARGYRHDMFCHLKTLGGFKYQPKKHDIIIMMQAYSLSKGAFYSHNNTSERQGLDVDPDSVFHLSSKMDSFVDKVKHELPYMQESSYGVRLEFRVKASLWSQNIMNLNEKLHLIIPYINWYDSEVLWSFVSRRFGALVSLAKNLAEQKLRHYTVNHMYGVALVSYLLASIFHRPLTRSWWYPYGQMIQDMACKKSSFIFLCGLFQLDSSNRYWTCTESSYSHLNGVFSSSIMKHVQVETMQVSESLQLEQELTLNSIVGYSFQTAPAALSTFRTYNFDASQLFPAIYTTSINHYYKNSCQDYFFGFGLTVASVEPFANLLLNEFVNKFTAWDKYLKNPEILQIFNLNGHNFFRCQSHLTSLLKINTFHVIKLGEAYQQKINNLLLPAPAFVLDNHKTESYICKSRGWKSMETRACYITLCINNPELHQDLENFRQH
ncbi:unnamed protein product, partial [Rhizopus stolonifer]